MQRYKKFFEAYERKPEIIELCKKWCPDKDFYTYQNSEKLEFLHKKLFHINGINYYYVEYIENAGDIGRELCKHEFADGGYIFEKIRKLERATTVNVDDLLETSINEEKEIEITSQYKKNFNGYPREKLGILGNISKIISFAVIGRNVPLLKGELHDFIKEWDKFQAEVEKIGRW